MSSLSLVRFLMILKESASSQSERFRAAMQMGRFFSGTLKFRKGSRNLYGNNFGAFKYVTIKVINIVAT